MPMKPVILIKYSVVAAFVILSMAAGCKSSLEPSARTQALIDSISGCYVPDHRMGVCDIKVKPGESGVLILSGETTNPHVKRDVINTLNNQGNKLIDSIIILPDTISIKRFKALATLSVINIRKHPDQRAELVSQALLGSPVLILKDKDGWILVQTPDHYIGWTESTSVAAMTSGEMAEWKHSDRVITLENSGWIYSSSGGSGITGDYVAGCILVRESVTNGFTKVRYPDGREGYIHSGAVTDFNIWKANAACTGANLAKTASSFTGLPYLWGGSSSKGVDCSGFSQQVYYLNGVILLRDASLQALHGTVVDISQGYGKLEQGDLLFFGTKQNSKPHVTHVAIYKGDTEYIHSSGRVMINSLDSTRINYSGFRENSLLVVKRIAGVDDDPGIMRIKSHPWY
jgi:SH3-like domain-containing protein